MQFVACSLEIVGPVRIVCCLEISVDIVLIWISFHRYIKQFNGTLDFTATLSITRMRKADYGVESGASYHPEDSWQMIFYKRSLPLNCLMMIGLRTEN